VERAAGAALAPDARTEERPHRPQKEPLESAACGSCSPRRSVPAAPQGNDAARRGISFTLIELFVVIPIIAVPAAILFPVFAQPRDKAKTVPESVSDAEVADPADTSWVMDAAGPEVWREAHVDCAPKNERQVIGRHGDWCRVVGR
jgi:hypothetical protein